RRRRRRAFSRWWTIARGSYAGRRYGHGGGAPAAKDRVRSSRTGGPGQGLSKRAVQSKPRRPVVRELPPRSRRAVAPAPPAPPAHPTAHVPPAPAAPAAPPAPGKRPFDLDDMIGRIRAAVAPFKKAAMF